MLQELSVKNFALIDKLTLSLNDGFNVITGETGAGKSIVIGALSLIIGSRGQTDLVRQGAEEAEVQALFTVDDQVAAKLEALGLPVEEDLIIRRVLTRTGRHRVYVNGVLATLSQLSSLGQDLVALTGQHEHQQLNSPDWQLRFLDQYGGLIDLRRRMTAAHTQMQELDRQVERFRRQIQEARARSDLFDFQAREIAEANLIEGEDQELEQERQLVRNAEKIYSLVHQGYDRLYGKSGAVVEILGAIGSDLQKAAAVDGRLTILANQVQDAYLQLDDVSRGLQQHLKTLTFDPARLDAIEDRLAILYRLKRKYGPTLSEVIRHGQEASAHLEIVEDLEQDLRDLQNRAAAAQKTALDLAGELHIHRQEAVRDLTQEVANSLRQLGMPHLEFTVSFRSGPPLAEDQIFPPGPLGYDEVEFLISPNVGEELKPLARIASGGELSRIMLGLCSVKAGRDQVQTLVFDEVDAGIGGVVAEVVGRKLKDLADRYQLICITHLPQIAAFGRHHFHVFKEVRGQRTVTDMLLLADNDRVAEIARMVGGAQPTITTLAAADEMLTKAHNY